MDINQQTEFDILCRAQSFLDYYGEALAKLNRTPARADLDRQIQLIREEASEQQRASEAGESQTRVKGEVHARLRREIARIRTLSETRPGNMPHLRAFKSLSKNTSDGYLEAYAGGIAGAAGAYGDVFRREGFGEDFVRQFRDLIEEFRAARKGRMSSEQRRFLAGRRIEGGLKEAWKTVALLAALFEPDDAGHQRLRAEWKVVTLHATRALPAPVEIPRLGTGEAGPMLALPAGDAQPPGMALVPNAEQPAQTAPRLGGRLLRLIGKLFRADEAA